MQRLRIIFLLLIFPFLAKADLVDSLKQHRLILSSPAFAHNGVYPKIYTCDSSAISPPLVWKNIPSGTKSFAITIHHFPRTGDKHVYMVLYNIPINQTEIIEGAKNIGIWGHNSLNKTLAYAPPCSQGPGEKSYIITIYALSKIIKPQKIDLTMDELAREMAGEILDTNTLTVKYIR